jgi:hypothetical protein
MTLVAKDGKMREMIMLPVKYLQGWLFTVDANRVKPEIKDRLLQYQRECFDVLNQYWQNKSLGSQVDTSSTAACFSELHVFIELTRGRIAISKRGTPYNSVSVATAMVLRYLYHIPGIERGVEVSNRKMAMELKIDARCSGRAIDRLNRWGFLSKDAKKAKASWICLNKKKVDDALVVSRNMLMSNQTGTGFLEYVH